MTAVGWAFQRLVRQFLGRLLPHQAPASSRPQVLFSGGLFNLLIIKANKRRMPRRGLRPHLKFHRNQSLVTVRLFELPATLPSNYMHWRDIRWYRVLSVDTKFQKDAMHAHSERECSHIFGLRCDERRLPTCADGWPGSIGHFRGQQLARGLVENPVLFAAVEIEALECVDALAQRELRIVRPQHNVIDPNVANRPYKL